MILHVFAATNGTSTILYMPYLYFFFQRSFQLSIATYYTQASYSPIGRGKLTCTESKC